MLKTSLEKYSEQLAREMKRAEIQNQLHVKSVEAARALLSSNTPIEEILQITGLPLEEIEKLKV